MADKKRELWRCNFRGLNTRSSADSIPPTKFPVAQNIRAAGDTSVKTRPGYVFSFNCDSGSSGTSVGGHVTDLRAYATLLTDNKPRIIAHDSSGAIFLDTGVQVGRVGTGGTGASLIPYRPSQSPQSWMYAANATGYQKYSAPTAANVVTEQKVGIAEPQSAPEACPDGAQYNDFTSTFNNWTPAGSSPAGATAAATRSTDTVAAIFQDPASVSPVTKTRYSVQVGTTAYSVGETLTFNKSSGGTVDSQVEEVLPPINGGTALTVVSIFYLSGVNGSCIVVPSQQPVGDPSFLPGQVAGLVRGSLVQIGSEVVLVLNVTAGPQGGIAFECSTVTPHVFGETIVGQPAIVCSGISSLVVGQAVTAAEITSTIPVGTGTLTQTLGTNPFNLAIGSRGTPQADDFIHISIQVDDATKVTSLKILFDVGDGSFTKNVLYYSVPVSSIQTASQWTEVLFSIADLVRIGNDQTKTLANCVKVQISAVVSATVAFGFGSLWVGGGGQPDVGDAGAPYIYRVRPRSSITGAKGNPSPEMRYGVLPRRQPVILSLPSASYDTQIDTWDIFRYGGTVTSWRMVGSTTSSATTFTDNVFDDSALAGELLSFDNFEPWPSVDVPYSQTVLDGVLNFLTIYGTAILVEANSYPANIGRWLPGTFITLDGQLTYTLWNRPIQVGSAWLLRIVEDAGTTVVSTISVNEPNIANQKNPYVWGPDANGVVFGAGDPLRPGALYSSTQFSPDTTPNNIYDLTPPSEPLLGGEVIDGLSLVASSERWWALQSAFAFPQRWNPIEMPAGRGLASPWGHCTDGRLVYFVAKDGIYSMPPLGIASSLTDADLYNLFPHNGIAGKDSTYAGFITYAPDYSRAAEFRLAIVNSLLKFNYLDSSGLRRCLVCDLSLDGQGQRRMAWSSDVYRDPMTCSYQPEQPEGTLATSTQFYPQSYMGDINGNVWIEQGLTNDGGNGPDGIVINGGLSTFEWDGGDLRQDKNFVDGFVDLLPAAHTGTGIQPVTNGVAVAGSTTVASGPRQQQIVSVGGIISQNYLGFLISWHDDFSVQTVATEINGWEFDYIPQPVTTEDAFLDWDDAGTPAAKFFQGFILTADTFNAPKNVLVRNGDTLVAAETFSCVHNGQQAIAYSFATPFIAHLVRIEPQEFIDWKIYAITWIFQPTPEVGTTWKTQPTTHGMTGFHHIRKLVWAYKADADVTLTITADDGTSPAAITLPSTGGASRKVEFVPTFNKGRMFTYSGVSTGNWAALLDKCEIHVGDWERNGNYSIYRNLGGEAGDQARV